MNRIALTEQDEHPLERPESDHAWPRARMPTMPQRAQSQTLRRNGETMSQKPSVGRVVHYVSYGTPGGEYSSTCRAAVITEVSSWVGSDSGQPHVGLAVLNPIGLFFATLNDGGCVYDAGAEMPGSPDCPNAAMHGAPMRYCGCGWREAGYPGGTWHWPERV